LVGELEGGMTKHLMERAAECATKRVLPGGTLLGVVLLLAVALSACATAASDARRTIQTTPAATSSPLLKPTPTAGPKPFLPGQAFWKDGASSLLFGTNDPDEYYANNIETQPFIQQQLKAAGATVIRTFIDEGTSDAQIDQRIATVQNIGAQCLVVISGINDLTYYKHVVSYIGDRCLMYDFGNEPDWNYISVQTYSKAWIAQVPVLRAINPHALFFGPVVSYPHTDFLKQFLINAQAANVLPDAVSFHWYACWKQAENVCLQRASLLLPSIQDVRSTIEQVLGHDLPIGVDEWNFDPSGPSASYGNTTEFVAPFYATVFSILVQAHVAYACQFDAASFNGYGDLDMFDVKTNQPKPQFIQFAKQIGLYQPTR
jgi:hypothetical protein